MLPDQKETYVDTSNLIGGYVLDSIDDMKEEGQPVLLPLDKDQFNLKKHVGLLLVPLVESESEEPTEELSQ
jgi:hypothetical protein